MVKKDLKLIGVDLGGTNVRAGLVYRDEITDLKTRAITSQGHADVVLEEVCETIEAVFKKDVRGIGIDVPSVVDADKGIVYNVANIPSWTEIPLKDLLEKRFNVPVLVNNDAKCFALGELHFGEGRGHRNLVGMILGTGMGAGVIINGKLFSGTNGGAGEVGHAPYLENEFEHFCSGRFFDREYGISAFEAEQRAEKGDPEALKMFAAFGSHLGNAVQTVLYAFDPEIIVLGGGVSKAFRHFEKPLWLNLKGGFRFPRSLERLKIVPTRKSNIAILAAAALCLDRE